MKVGKSKMKTLRGKIFIGFMTVLAIGMALGIAGVASIRIIENLSSEHEKLQTINTSVKNVLNAHYVWRQTLTEAVLNGVKFEGALDPSTCALGKWINSGETKSITDSEILSMMVQLNEPHNYIHTEAQKIQMLIDEGNLSEAKMYLNSHIMPKADEAISILADMSERYSDLIHSEADDLIRLENLMTVVIVLLLVVSSVVGIIVSMVISGGIEKKLAYILHNIENSTDIINSAAIDLTVVSEDLADGSTRQAAAIEETSATMNESSSMIAQTADSTKKAVEISLILASKAQNSIENMKKMIESMNELKTSSDTIARIIHTIDDISRNTNLLAINATVEAARAGGDAGRSFAVVAGEVRNLAQRSAKSAAETNEIISQNLVLTSKCGEISNNVASELNRVIDEIKGLNKIIEDISVASNEQSHGIRQINIAIAEMEKITQRNASVAGETSESSCKLKEETGNLENIVSAASGLIKKR